MSFRSIMPKKTLDTSPLFPQGRLLDLSILDMPKVLPPQTSR